MNLPRCVPFLLAIIAVISACSPVFAGPAGIEIIGTDRVLEEWAQRGQDGTLYLEDASGTLRRFVTSTDDPVITNPGSGTFHPIPRRTVEEALEAILPSFTASLTVTILILPYPVESPLGSWAGEATIYLSPGVYPLDARQIHLLVAHEIGHIVHRSHLPDSDSEGWTRFRMLRGIRDTLRYYDEAIHRDRPHEIFAEDFRVLFGGPIARDGGLIENRDLALPEDVPGLREFFVGLLPTPPESEPEPETLVRVYPNPVRPGQVLRVALPGSKTVEGVRLYDVAGRSVRSIDTVVSLGGGLFEIRWDGRDDQGRRLARGVYYMQVRGGSASGKASLRLVE